MKEYIKELKTGEYRNILEFAMMFKGNLSTKIAALRIIEKISICSSKGTVKSNEGKDLLPEIITVSFTKPELDGYWHGLVDFVSDENNKVQYLLLAKGICSVLGMTNRFSELENTINIPDADIPLD